MTEPFYIRQTSAFDRYNTEQREAWFMATVTDARYCGATHFRTSIDHKLFPKKAMVEAWKEYQEDCGPRRWEGEDEE